MMNTHDPRLSWPAARPLGDPLRVRLRLLLAAFVIAEGVQWWMRGVVDPIWLSILLLLMLVLPRRRPDAIYLRTFHTDEASWEPRYLVAMAIRPLRLSGIRPPRRRTHPLLWIPFLPFTTLAYLFGRHMDLEAGSDWQSRLVHTIREVRMVFLDLRSWTENVEHEIRLGHFGAGVERVMFIIDDARDVDQWRSTIGRLLRLPEARHPEIRLVVWPSPAPLDPQDSIVAMHEKTMAAAFFAEVKAFAASCPAAPRRDVLPEALDEVIGATDRTARPGLRVAIEAASTCLTIAVLLHLFYSPDPLSWPLDLRGTLVGSFRGFLARLTIYGLHFVIVTALGYVAASMLHFVGSFLWGKFTDSPAYQVAPHRIRYFGLWHRWPHLYAAIFGGSLASYETYSYVQALRRYDHYWTWMDVHDLQMEATQYLRREGRCPLSLEVLPVNARLWGARRCNELQRGFSDNPAAAESDLLGKVDPWCGRYVILCPGDHEEIDVMSAGPDGVIKSIDDILSWSADPPEELLLRRARGGQERGGHRAR